MSMPLPVEVKLFSGTSNPGLAQGVAAELGITIGEITVEKFPDGEIHVDVLESVRGCDVYLLQSTGPPVAENLLELLLVADACHRAGSDRITAVIPYFGYARQDRRARGREPVSARLVSDLIGCSSIKRIVAVDLHTPAIEGFFSIPVEHVTAVSILADKVMKKLPDRSIVVAPDLGSVKLAHRYAALFGLPVAIVVKERISPGRVKVGGIVGDVAGRSPVIVDDMISTGGTVEAAVTALKEAGCGHDITVAATHALLVGNAYERLHSCGVRRLFATDSLPQRSDPVLQASTVTVAPLLAECIRRLATNETLRDFIVRR